LSGQDIKKLDIGLPNIVPVEVDGLSLQQRIGAVLAKCDASYIAVVPEGFKIREFWVEDCLYAVSQNPLGGEVFELEDSSEGLWGGIFERQLLENLISDMSGSLLDSVKKSGRKIRKMQPQEIVFQYDQLLSKARTLMQQENFTDAAELFEHIAKNYGNELWIGILAAQAHLKSGNLQRAKQISGRLNGVFPSVESIITEAQSEKGFKNYDRAVRLFENALEIIEGKHPIWT
jgi:tetratricopeptide (TPR) repeat protein